MAELQKEEENEIHEKLKDKTRANLRHLMIISSSTAFIVITLIALIRCTVYFLYRRYKYNKTTQRPQENHSMENAYY